MDYLWNEYFDHKKQEDALDKWDALMLRPSDNFQTFRNSFVRLAGLTRKPKDTWKSEFKRKLTPYLQTALARDYRDKRCAFDEFAQLAADIANTQRQAEKRQQKDAKPSGTGTRPGGTGRSENRPAATKTIAQKGQGTFQRPTGAEAAQLAREGRCFLCREKGHMASTCPQKITGVGSVAPREDDYWNKMVDRIYGEDSAQPSAAPRIEVPAEPKN
jgi:hypothetical protein